MEQAHALPADSSGHHPPLVDHELTTIREMLETLNTLSIAGQRHLMSKIVAFVGGHVDGIMRTARDGSARKLAELLALLKNESDRPLPSVAAFGEHTETMLGLLSEARGAARAPRPAEDAPALPVRRMSRAGGEREVHPVAAFCAPAA